MPSVDGVEHLSCSLRPPTLDDIQSAFVETSVSDTIDNNDETQASTLDQPANGECTTYPEINSIDSMERGETVEEIFRASLSFDRSSSFCLSGSLPLIGASLYPNVARIEDADGISTTAQLEQGKREQSENIRVESTYAEASLNTLTEEAVVLGSARMSDDPWDEMTVEDREILAMKRAAYAGERSDPLVAQNIKKHGQEATVVAISEYDVHPNEIVQDAVRAELVGQDFTRTVSNAMDNENVESTEADEFTVSAVFSALRTVDNEATEATVIDSAPLASEEDIPSWKHTEEAQVLVLDTSLPLIDVKPAAVDFSEYSNSGIEPIADQEAEVLGIQEEIHPSEVSENETEAELVGTDHNFAFTLANESHLDRNTARSDEPNELRQVDFVVETVDGGSDGEEPISFGNVRAALLVPTILNAETVDSIPTVAPFTRSLSMEGTDTSFRDDTSAQTGNGSAFPLPLPPPRQTAEPSTRNSSVGEEDNSRPDWLRDSPEQLPLGSETVQREASNASGRSAGSTGNQIVQRTSSQLQVLSSSIARGTNKAFEALFGDAKPPFVSRRRLADGEAARYIVSRTLLPASVIFSQPTKMWIATLQTNQKALDSNDVMEASKSLRAFSLPSERQAKCLAQAWTPPRMEPFANHPLCNTCQSKFAVFRRACHCRNCGVCVCKDCTVTWPAKMVPETYNIKKTATVNICKACDWLCNSFRLALLEGDQDKAVALYATGNINIVCPFGNVKGELFYPVHACVLGESLSILRWLVDENCCPIKSVRVNGRTKDGICNYTAIVTSKGRSLLGIAMENNLIPIVRYLVVEKGLSLAEEKSLTRETLVQNLQLALRVIPNATTSTEAIEMDVSEALYHDATVNDSAEADLGDTTSPLSSEYQNVVPVPIPDREQGSERDLPGGRTLSEEARNFGAISRPGRGSFSYDGRQDENECIICFDANIDCVATPCGHQVCCLDCSEHLSRCPVCAMPTSFMRVFKV